MTMSGWPTHTVAVERRKQVGVTLVFQRQYCRILPLDVKTVSGRCPRIEIEPVILASVTIFQTCSPVTWNSIPINWCHHVPVSESSPNLPTRVNAA